MGRGHNTILAVATLQRKTSDLFTDILGETRGSDRQDDDSLYKETSKAGVIRYYQYQGGPLHREDGPAVQYGEGGEEYWVDGEMTSFTFSCPPSKRRAVLLNWLEEAYKQYNHGLTITDVITFTDIYKGSGCYNRCYTDCKHLLRQGKVTKTNGGRWLVT
jgi:hypothetical protein